MFLEQSLVSRPVPVAARRHMGREDEVSLAVSTGRQKQSASPYHLRGCCCPKLSLVRKLRVFQPKIPDSQPNVCGPCVDNPQRPSARKMIVLSSLKPFLMITICTSTTRHTGDLGVDSDSQKKCSETALIAPLQKQAARWWCVSLKVQSLSPWDLNQILSALKRETVLLSREQNAYISSMLKKMISFFCCFRTSRW